MIVGVPLFAVIYDIVKKLMLHGLHRNGKSEMYEEYHAKFGESAEGAKKPTEIKDNMQP